MVSNDFSMYSETSRSGLAGALRIVFIYRKASPGAFSIEALFQTICRELSGRVEVVEYEASGLFGALWDFWRLRRLKADIYHVTGDVHYWTLLLPLGRSILTIHDIGHYLYSLNGFKRLSYKWLWLILPIRRAGMVTAVSERTRCDIIERLGVTDRAIPVVENCHQPFFEPAPRPFNQDRPTILQVGTKAYKNARRLVEALKGVRCRLILLGELSEELIRALRENRVSHDNHVNVSSEALHELYLNCDLVSFVSTGEGFGLPIIEAQAVGRPVITSNIPPMSDVAGEGACLVDPLSVDEIRAGVERIVNDRLYREQLVVNGFDNVARYSPAVIAARYLGLYNQLRLG